MLERESLLCPGQRLISLQLTVLQRALQQAPVPATSRSFSLFHTPPSLYSMPLTLCDLLLWEKLSEPSLLTVLCQLQRVSFIVCWVVFLQVVRLSTLSFVVVRSNCYVYNIYYCGLKEQHQAIYLLYVGVVTLTIHMFAENCWIVWAHDVVMSTHHLLNTFLALVCLILHCC